MFDAPENGDEIDTTDGETPQDSDETSGDKFDSDSACRSILGVSQDASWQQICDAHTRLVADVTPGAQADHGRVHLALAILDEVNEAFFTLQRRAVA